VSTSKKKISDLTTLTFIHFSIFRSVWLWAPYQSSLVLYIWSTQFLDLSTMPSMRTTTANIKKGSWMVFFFILKNNFFHFQMSDTLLK
jgi:hypothetical protein